MGIMSNRNSQGNSTALWYCQPGNNTTRSAIKNKSDTRDRNSSAPSTPTTNVHRAKAMISNPLHEGFCGMAARRERSCQMTYAAKRGTKKPCEKLGSPHHCATNLPKMGA